MSYVSKVLQAGEQVRFTGALHWIIYKNALLLLVGACVMAVVPFVHATADARRMFLGTVVLALVSIAEGARAWVVQATTEIAVTDKRVIFKQGFISRRTEEINISKVESVDVDQDIAGRVLGYGSVVIRGTGGSWEPLRMVADPLGLRNSILVG